MQIDTKAIRLMQTTDSDTLLFVNYFHATQNQYMLFWLLKDAQLTCKRCPFEV